LNLSITLNNLSDYGKAESYAHSAENIFRNNNNFISIYRAQVQIAKALRNQNKFKKAVKYFESSQNGFRSLKNPELAMIVEAEKLKGYLYSSDWHLANQSYINLTRFIKRKASLKNRPEFAEAINNYEKAIQNKKGDGAIVTF
jgi:tetratricopeptide (TPR) repeat protein